MKELRGCGAAECAIKPGTHTELCVCAESEIQDAILLTYGSQPGVVLYRNNRGVARSERVTEGHLHRLVSLLNAGSPADYAMSLALALVRDLLNAPQRFTQFGLAPGGSDIIGHVYNERKGVAAFTAIEVKRMHGGRPTKEQLDFIECTERNGGVAGVARTLAQAAEIVSRARSM